MEEVDEDTWDANNWSEILVDMIGICTRVQGARERVNVCPEQSSYLAQKFQDLVQHLGQLDFASEVIHCKQAVGEIVHLMSRGGHLIDSCASSEWIWNAVLKEENKMGFQDVLHDLHSSISYINDILSRSQAGGAEPRIFPTIAWTEERGKLNEMADSDRKHLTRMVKGALEARRWTSFQAACCRQRSRLPKFLYDLLGNPRGSLGDVVMLPDRHIYLFLNPAHLQQGRRIGSGAYGDVHEARWLGKAVVVKTAFSSHDQSFMREVTALIFLRHPNVVRMIGYTRKSKSSPYALVMERMERDLHHLIRDIVEKQRGPPFTLDVALDIILQIAKGMKFLHSKDVVHLDLKTDNILVNLPKNTSAKFFTAKLSDFGLAQTKFISGGDNPVGTIIYMAPEVWDKESTYTKKADVYSFAMTCYEVLVGERPSGPPAAFFEKVTVQNLRPTLPPGFRADLTEFLQRCWHGNPEFRPSFTQICNYLISHKVADLEAIPVRDYHEEAVASLEYTRTRMQNAPSSSSRRNAVMKYEADVLHVIQLIRTLRDRYNQLESEGIALPRQVGLCLILGTMFIIVIFIIIGLMFYRLGLVLPDLTFLYSETGWYAMGGSSCISATLQPPIKS